MKKAIRKEDSFSQRERKINSPVRRPGIIFIFCGASVKCGLPFINDPVKFIPTFHYSMITAASYCWLFTPRLKPLEPTYFSVIFFKLYFFVKLSRNCPKGERQQLFPTWKLVLVGEPVQNSWQQWVLVRRQGQSSTTGCHTCRKQVFLGRMRDKWVPLLSSEPCLIFWRGVAEKGRGAGRHISAWNIASLQSLRQQPNLGLHW